ncbi:DNA mismatch repair endonuclease MutL [Geoalkalibacter halelectricus]|uniref:DNA mismatch repair protein MutL n=1 Tax=Geoalkalibacter halelectricus TaxID=2847045 RepID=A0ABY5ZIC3_9BACT|nr:DNA mismatch repair endonuclease MutL [Geoalkalibacter halelectricus]UWZ78461.1 DNA mismatch repair endonuclease MutL [Geoalkalibacter halelectricus]
MTSKVTILPENLCNMIAAGEVVERPASVIKELVENSLDAGAGDILVEVEGGGKKLMRVSDDGEGMSRDDAFLCLERHATSKIRAPQDLAALRTLGFRGEALPAIASVSRMTLRTCGNDEGEGVEIYLEGGTVRKSQDLGLPRGTLIEVRSLFFNTPARRKFLRRDETEIGHIADVVTKQALAHPRVRFRLLHNGRELFEVRRDSLLEERIGAFLGRPLLRQLVPVAEGEPGDLSLRGFICPPEVTRSSTGAIYTFINGRYVRDRVVQHAVLEGYRNLLMKGRYPVVVLFLELDPAQVDVNVHPTKHEVRFRDQGRVHDFIAEGLRRVLKPSPGLGVATPPAHPAPDLAPRPAAQFHASPGAAAPADQARERVHEALVQYERRTQAGSAPPAQSGRPPAAAAPCLAAAAPDSGGFFQNLRYIGQYRNSYLLCQDGDDLVLVDQHAAHERIRFEQLREGYRRGTPARQALLFPLVVEFDFKGAAVLAEHLDLLTKFGFDVEAFGGKAFAVKALPAQLAEADVERLLRDVVGDLEQVGKSGAAEDVLDDFLMRLACHGVVRANQSLAPAEAQALLKALDGVDFKAHCPHGRPVQVRLGLTEIERLFRRG